MSLSSIAVTTLLITPSGALSPGPLTVATMTLGSRYGWRAGVSVALGHMLVELPYLLVLFYAFKHIETFLQGVAGDILTVAAAIVIFYFSYLTAKDALKGASLSSGQSLSKTMRSPIVVGITFTGLNVYFLLWWTSIGFVLLSKTISYGLLGLGVMYVSHVWIDYVWLALVAEACYRGTKLMGGKGYRAMLAVFAGLLTVFGMNMLTSRFVGVSIIPW